MAGAIANAITNAITNAISCVRGMWKRVNHEIASPETAAHVTDWPVGSFTTSTQPAKACLWHLLALDRAHSWNALVRSLTMLPAA